jgi:predicted helicase
MPLMSSGIKTHKDDFAVSMDRNLLEERIEDTRILSEEALREKYRLGDDVRDWKVSYAQQDVRDGFSSENICQYSYRPFDSRWTFLSGKTKGFLSYPRADVMAHLQAKDNLAFNLCRQLSGSFFAHGLVSNAPLDLNSLSLQTKEQSYCAPLYLYPEEGTLETERRVNFDPKIYAEIRERAGLSRPLPSGEGGAANAAGGEGDQPTEAPSPSHAARGSLPLPQGEEIPDELLVFDYIYGVLHSPDYRRTYAQFLKIDFPRIPYPASPEVFAHVAEKGGQLRRLHLMEDAAIGATPYPFKGDGDNVVVKPTLSDDGRVMINPDQWFEGVPQIAWEFHIGGYQPAQKWLKDRKGRALSFDDVMHYQKIIKILCETDRIMKEIELPL